MRSLRRTLILGTMAGASVVLAVCGFFLYALVRTDLLHEFDLALIQKARQVAAAVEESRGKIRLDVEKLDMSEFTGPEAKGYLQLGLGGRVIHRTPSLGSAELPWDGTGASSARCRWIPLPGGRTGRGIAFTFTPRLDLDEEDEHGEPAPPGGESTALGALAPEEHRARSHLRLQLAMARDVSSVTEALSRMRSLLLLVGALTVTATSGVLWVVIRRELRPLDRLADRIGRVDENELSSAIDLGRGPSELEPVVARLNAVFRRLESAFVRERAFSAEVAHELRTPLAGLRSILEVAGRRPRREEEYVEAIADGLEITLEMGAMVENLLSIARLETGAVRLKPEELSLETLLAKAWEPLADTALERRLQVRWSLAEETSLTADRTVLGMAVQNLLENAVQHADPGGRVTVETGAGEESAFLRVANSGSRIPRERAGDVFERFFRGDPARSATGGHCGLGLFLVRKAARAMGGEVHAESEAGGEFSVTLRIPLCAEASGADAEAEVFPGGPPGGV